MAKQNERYSFTFEISCVIMRYPNGDDFWGTGALDVDLTWSDDEGGYKVALDSAGIDTSINDAEEIYNHDVRNQLADSLPSYGLEEADLVDGGWL